MDSTLSGINDTPLFYDLLLHHLPGVGPRRYWSLIKQFGSVENVLSAPVAQLSFLNDSAKKLLIDFQKQPDDNHLKQMAANSILLATNSGAKILSIHQPEYPELLKNITDPPTVLYVKGNIEALHLPQIAIVGSRHATQQGLKNTQLFASHLCKNGFVITSGLALGIDQQAHQTTVHTKEKTIAVMATGIDRIYPKQNHGLAQSILDNGGALVTEFPPDSQPKPGHFPRRNRIISGLSLGTLVIEATLRSGSLITSRFAMEQGREVFAIPGPIHNPQSKGCHSLIKQGATLVENSHDIVEHLSGLLNHLNDQIAPQINTASDNETETPITEELASLSEEECAILKQLQYDASTLDDLVDLTHFTSQAISAALINLEISGKVRRSHRGYEKV